MRHVRSILYALVLAPAVWVLCGVGFTQDLTSRAQDSAGGFEKAGAALLVLLAGLAYAILLFAPISPAGPASAGFVFLAVSGWALLNPGGYASVWSTGVTRDGFNLSRPGYALAALLAIPLLCTALSARRWERYEPPQLPIIGTLGRARASVAAPGTPMASERTAVISTADPDERPEPTVIFAVDNTGDTTAVGLADQSTTDVMAEAPTADVAATDEPTEQQATTDPTGKSTDAEPTVNFAADNGDEPTTTIIGTEPTTRDLPTAAGVTDKSTTTDAAGEEPTRAESTRTVTEDATDEITAAIADEHSDPEPMAEPVDEDKAEVAAVLESIATALTAAVAKLETAEDKPIAAGEFGEDSDGETTSGGETTTVISAQTEAGDEAIADADTAAHPTAEHPTEAHPADAHPADAHPTDAQAAAAQAADDNDDATTVLPLRVEPSHDDDDATTLLRLPGAADNEADPPGVTGVVPEKERVSKPGVGTPAAEDGERTQIIRLPRTDEVGGTTRDFRGGGKTYLDGPGEQTQVIFRVEPVDADARAKADELEAERDLAAQQRARQAFKDRAAQERAREASDERAATEARRTGEQTQIIKVIKPDAPSIMGEERPDPGEDPTTLLGQPPERPLEKKRPRSMLASERPPDEADDDTRLLIPHQRESPEQPKAERHDAKDQPKR